MRKGRNGSRRSFTVEVKSGERGGAIIPSRVAVVAKPTPQLFMPAKTEAPPVAEKRRILPNLIAPEPEPVAIEAAPPRKRGRPRKAPLATAEPMQAIEGHAQPRKRGRPRKVQPAPVEPIAVEVALLTAPPPATPAPPARTARPMARKVALKPGKALPAAERWKRRLGRWSR